MADAPARRSARCPPRGIVIVTPALAEANNGNWQTAHRWAGLLGSRGRGATLAGSLGTSPDLSRALGRTAIRITDRWTEGDEALMIALHARRSAPSMAAWRAAHPARPLVLVLTGTDLYRDIHTDAAAQAALRQAQALCVLNELGVARLPADLHSRCHVVLQSCSARQPRPKPATCLRVLMVGHLRDEKDPLTYLRAAERLAGRRDIRLDHIGGALDPALGQAARALAERLPSYRWLGPRLHDDVRRRIQSAHVLVHTSRMEGGAQVVIEAVRSGTPVIASRIDGHLGLLGRGYAGTFEVGDDASLAGLIARARDDADMLPALWRQCAARAALFSPSAESAALHRLLAPLLSAAEPEPPAP